MKDLYENEKWLPCVGFEKTHEISDHGRIRSLPRYQNGISRNGTTFRRMLRGKILKTSVNVSGYEFVSPMIEKSMNVVLIHRAVAMAHCPNPNNASRVIHLDSVKTNNHASNLIWGENVDVMRIAKENGRLSERFNRQVLNWRDVVDIRKRYNDGSTSQVKLSREYGVSQGQISNIIHNRTWKSNVRQVDKNGEVSGVFNMPDEEKRLNKNEYAKKRYKASKYNA